MIFHVVRDGYIRSQALENHALSMQRLLQTVSHEIRSPLNVVIGAMQLMALESRSSPKVAAKIRRDDHRLKVREMSVLFGESLKRRNKEHPLFGDASGSAAQSGGE